MRVATDHIQAGCCVGVVLEAVGLSRSVYYYKQRSGRRGKTASTHTYTQAGVAVANQQVVEQIQELLQQEFVDYGYIKVTWWLRQKLQYHINFKKVYRLMKQHRLLLPRRRPKLNRPWVQQYVLRPQKAFEWIQMDIKYIYIHGTQRMAYLLTAIDVYSRAVLVQMLRYSIRKHDVASLLTVLAASYKLPKTVVVRNDNGSQFIAQLVREHLQQLHITQEFIRPATPQQNGHIEAWHSIVQRAICQHFEFESLQQALDVFRRFAHFYNHQRIHSGIAFQAPVQYLRSQHYDVQVFDCDKLPLIQDTTESQTDLSIKHSTTLQSRIHV